MINFLFFQNLFNASATSCQIFHNHPTAISNIQYLFVKSWLPNTKIAEQGHDQPAIQLITSFIFFYLAWRVSASRNLVRLQATHQRRLAILCLLCQTIYGISALFFAMAYPEILPHHQRWQPFCQQWRYPPYFLHTSCVIQMTSKCLCDKIFMISKKNGDDSIKPIYEIDFSECGRKSVIYEWPGEFNGDRFSGRALPVQLLAQTLIFTCWWNPYKHMALNEPTPETLRTAYRI